MVRLHDFRESGNGYKVRLLLRFLGQSYDYVEHDILKGETRTPAFLALNPDGRIPVLELEDGTALSQSDAILFYLAQDTNWWPQTKLARAKVLEWMFFEQYSHEPAIAVSRFLLHFVPASPERDKRLADLKPKGEAALGVMERRLKDHDFLVGESATIADIALYAYSHSAGEGGFDLAPFPGIRAWLKRIECIDGYAPIQAS